MAERKLVLTKSFSKAFKKFAGTNSHLKDAIEAALSDLEKDAFASHLRTHKLSGNLFGLFACSCGYDCRIVFSIEKKKGSESEIILLVGIGTHDEVY